MGLLQFSPTSRSKQAGCGSDSSALPHSTTAACASGWDTPKLLPCWVDKVTSHECWPTSSSGATCQAGSDTQKVIATETLVGSAPVTSVAS